MMWYAFGLVVLCNFEAKWYGGKLRCFLYINFFGGIVVPLESLDRAFLLWGGGTGTWSKENSCDAGEEQDSYCSMLTVL